MKKIMTVIAVIGVLASCNMNMGTDPSDVSRSGSDSGDSTYDPVDSTTGEMKSIQFDEVASSDLSEYSFESSQADLDGDSTPETSVFTVSDGVVTLAPEMTGTGGWFEFSSPEFDVKTAEGDVTASFDFRYPDEFPYGSQNEERAKFYFDLNHEGGKMLGLTFKPKMSGNGVNHMEISDSSGNLAGKQLASNVESGADSLWYTAELEITSSGSVTFTLYYNGSLVDSISASIGGPVEIDDFTFTYRTTDDPKFYTIEVDNISVEYIN